MEVISMKELALGLLCVMGANVLLESVIGKFGDHFTFRCFMVIITKYLCIIVSFVLLYVAAYYNPDVIVANINNSNVNLMDSMKILFISGIIMYACKDLVKLKDVLKIPVDIMDGEESSVLDVKDEIVSIPVNNDIKKENN